jgi:hypothetical protein
VVAEGGRAILPRWFDSDALMMQKAPDHFSEIQILSDKTQKFCDAVARDLREVMKNG